MTGTSTWSPAYRTPAVWQEASEFQVKRRRLHVWCTRITQLVKQDVMWWVNESCDPTARGDTILFSCGCLKTFSVIKSNRLSRLTTNASGNHQVLSCYRRCPLLDRFKTHPTAPSTNLTHLCLRLHPLTLRLRLLQFGLLLSLFLLPFLQVICRRRAGCRRRFNVAVCGLPLPLQSTVTDFSYNQ